MSIADSFATEEIERRLAMVGATLCVTCDTSVRAGKTIPLYTKVAAARLGAGGYVICLRAATTDHKSPLGLQGRDVAFDHWLEVRAKGHHKPSKEETCDQLEWTVPIPLTRDGEHHKHTRTLTMGAGGSAQAQDVQLLHTLKFQSCLRT